MPKQRSTLSATADRRTTQKKQIRKDSGKNLDKALSPSEMTIKYAEMARNLVLAAWPGIVKGLIKKAMGGGYQQTKLLLDLCEVAHMDASELNEQHKEQLCDVLLDGLGLSAHRPKDGMRESNRPKTTVSSEAQ